MIPGLIHRSATRCSLSRGSLLRTVQPHTWDWTSLVRTNRHCERTGGPRGGGPGPRPPAAAHFLGFRDFKLFESVAQRPPLDRGDTLRQERQRIDSSNKWQLFAFFLHEGSSKLWVLFGRIPEVLSLVLSDRYKVVSFFLFSCTSCLIDFEQAEQVGVGIAKQRSEIRFWSEEITKVREHRSALKSRLVLRRDHESGWG
jgi:hypothetical protein